MKNLIQLFVFGLILMITLPSFKSNNSVNFTTDNDSLQYKKTPFVNYDEFEKLVKKVKKHRKDKLIGWNQFKQKSKQKNTIILDTRSKKMYDQKHIKGAIHLNFADFNQFSLDSIANLYNGRETQILIYCNNNFEDKGNSLGIDGIQVLDIDASMFSKVALPLERMEELRESTEATTIPESELTLALNIPTYINLYGYGYRNVYELNELIDVKDERVEFEGTFKNQ